MASEEVQDVFYSLVDVQKWVKYKKKKCEEYIGFVVEILWGPESIDIWSLQSQVDSTNSEHPWLFLSYNKKPVWIHEIVNLEDLEAIEIVDDQEYDTSLFNDPNALRKVVGDRAANYGGIEFSLTYPIWCCNALKIDESTRTELLSDLLQLNDQLKDYQQYTPVEDIIDPDLGPLRIQGDHITRKTQEYKRLENESRLDGNFHRKIGYFHKSSRNMNISEGIKIRETYKWLPSQFFISQEGHVRILSRIHNLPPTLQNARTYKNIAQVFEAMVPMFKNLHVIKENSELQVIVKAQSYRLLPDMTYAGRWHVEGQTENIVAVGVYYLQVDEGLTGGNLKFRPATSAQPFTNIDCDCEMETKQGAAVVFANMLPHRFRKIRNYTQEEKRRTFINFFIVDPSAPITSTRDVPSVSLLERALASNSVPKPIIKQIFSYLPYLWISTKEAKKFRKIAREAMKTEKSGWGWINWGNCGTVEFVSAESTWELAARQEIYGIKHTDSG